MKSPAITRSEFIRRAGGVYESDVRYDQLSSSEKWNKFWAFFFDTEHEGVTSVYGDIPISKLRKHRRLSIEHIIPRSTLHHTLNLQQASTLRINGATTNPFNLAPSDRFLNKTRASFPFDLEGDRVDRPFDIYMNPSAKGLTGLDADQEWVIPKQSRGDIARAILYMMVIYELDELYATHTKTLTEWSQADPPLEWEIAYNRWAQKQFHICNPLITTPMSRFELHS